MSDIAIVLIGCVIAGLLLWGAICLVTRDNDEHH